MLDNPIIIAWAAFAMALTDIVKRRWSKLDGWPGIPVALLFSAAIVAVETDAFILGTFARQTGATFLGAIGGHQLIRMISPKPVELRAVLDTTDDRPTDPPASSSVRSLFPPVAILALALVGCGLSPRHVAAESALVVTDVLEEAEPQIRSQCLLPYAYASRVDDRASMRAIDAECAPKVAAYDGARAAVVATRLALSLDDLDALKRLGPELLAAGQRLLALIGGAK